MAIDHMDPFIQKLIKTLGIDRDKAKGFELRCYCGEIATVKVEYMFDPLSGETITEQFRLEKIEEEDEK